MAVRSIPSAPSGVISPLPSEILKLLKAFFDSFSSPIQPEYCFFSAAANTVTIHVNVNVNMLAVEQLDAGVYWCEFAEFAPLPTVTSTINFMKENMYMSAMALLRAFLSVAGPGMALFVVRTLTMIEISLIPCCKATDTKREIYVHSVKQ